MSIEVVEPADLVDLECELFEKIDGLKEDLACAIAQMEAIERALGQLEDDFGDSAGALAARLDLIDAIIGRLAGT